MAAHVLEKQRNQTARPNVFSNRQIRKLTNCLSCWGGLNFKLRVVGGECGRYLPVHDFAINGEIPRKHLTRSWMTEIAAPMRRQVVQRLRRTATFQVGRRGQIMSRPGKIQRAITPSSGDWPILNPTSTRSATQLLFPPSNCTSGCTSGWDLQNSSMAGIRIGANGDFGPTIRSGPAISSFDARAWLRARSSAASAGCVVSRRR